MMASTTELGDQRRHEWFWRRSVCLLCGKRIASHAGTARIQHVRAYERRGEILTLKAAIEAYYCLDREAKDRVRERGA